MIELASFLWLMIIFHAAIGFMRGWGKELVATAGIVLALFALRQLETVLIDPLTDGRQIAKFNMQLFILFVIGFFAYQTPPETLSRRERRFERETFQEGILGALVGSLNGYLFWGSLWWYMDSAQYPMAPYIQPVLPQSASADYVDYLPLSWMLSGDGSVLSLIMIALFVFVIVAII